MLRKLTVSTLYAFIDVISSVSVFVFQLIAMLAVNVREIPSSVPLVKSVVSQNQGLITSWLANATNGE